MTPGNPEACLPAPSGRVSMARSDPAGVGRGSRCRDTERNEPHEEEARAELEVHVAARLDEAALAEDRHRFDCLLEREDHA